MNPTASHSRLIRAEKEAYKKRESRGDQKINTSFAERSTNTGDESLEMGLLVF